MQRLTHKRENGIKRGYWSPNKKQELVDRLAMYEDAAEKEKFGKCNPIIEILTDTDEYILISCSKYTGLCICRYEKNEDGSGNFYQGDDDDALLSYGLFVNAWMPLPKPYREVDDEQNQ